jgi:transcriptional regulator with XRE-family HTH domain
MEKPQLGSYVAARRKTLNLAQADLAKALGYTNQAISKFEMGGSQISIAVLPELADLLKISLDDLFAMNPDPKPAGTNPRFNATQLQNNLAALRSSHNVSQRQEAKIMDVTVRSIQNYESGDSLPSFSSLVSLLAFYGVTASFYSSKR